MQTCRDAARGAIAAALALMGSSSCALAQQGPWPNKVEAHYKILLAGFELGNFHWVSAVNGASFDLQGRGELSAAFGAWKWRGTSQASGRVEAETPRPGAYKYEWRTSKAGSTTMTFSDGKVTNVVAVPENKPSPEAVPVKPEHLVGVFDPMSAIMALSVAPSGNPCGRRISVFDGKQRFDLVLTFRRQEKVTEAKPSGQPTMAVVCQVRYVPVSGHKNSTEVNQMTKAENIEVAFRPIPSANLLVPYKITIPTMIGTAEMLSKRVDITTPNKGQIALNY